MERELEAEFAKHLHETSEVATKPTDVPTESATMDPTTATIVPKQPVHPVATIVPTPNTMFFNKETCAPLENPGATIVPTPHTMFFNKETGDPLVPPSAPLVPPQPSVTGSLASGLDDGLFPSAIHDPEVERQVHERFEKLGQRELQQLVKDAPTHPEYDSYVRALKLEHGLDDEEWSFGRDDWYEDLVNLYVWSACRQRLRERLALEKPGAASMPSGSVTSSSSIVSSIPSVAVTPAEVAPAEETPKVLSPVPPVEVPTPVRWEGWEKFKVPKAKHPADTAAMPKNALTPAPKASPVLEVPYGRYHPRTHLEETQATVIDSPEPPTPETAKAPAPAPGAPAAPAAPPAPTAPPAPAAPPVPAAPPAPAGPPAAPVPAAPPAPAAATDAPVPKAAAPVPKADPAVPPPGTLSERVSAVVDAVKTEETPGPESELPSSKTHRAEYMAYLRAARNPQKLPEGLRQMFMSTDSRLDLFRLWLSKGRDFSQVEVEVQRRNSQSEKASSKNLCLSRAQLIASGKYSESDIDDLIARCTASGAFIPDPNFPNKVEYRQYYVNSETAKEVAKTREDLQTVSSRTAATAAEALELTTEGGDFSAGAVPGIGDVAGMVGGMAAIPGGGQALPAPKAEPKRRGRKGGGKGGKNGENPADGTPQPDKVATPLEKANLLKTKVLPSLDLIHFFCHQVDTTFLF